MEALDHLRTGAFRLGPEWQVARALCQRLEGEAGWDRLHALCHRIKGDEANARYWYRSAGIAPVPGSMPIKLRHRGPVLAKPYAHDHR
jgi:hypothetical protein